MPKPLHTDDSPQPNDQQFKHFGVLNAGGQSKGSLFTSIVVNIVLALHEARQHLLADGDGA